MKEKEDDWHWHAEALQAEAEARKAQLEVSQNIENLLKTQTISQSRLAKKLGTDGKTLWR